MFCACLLQINGKKTAFAASFALCLELVPVAANLPSGRRISPSGSSARIGVASELVIIKTQGDLVQHLSFDKLEGKGFFTKEIEDALLRGDVDLAVHSMKDLPTMPPRGPGDHCRFLPRQSGRLVAGTREAVDPSQVFKLKQGAVVGTSANRRKAQLLDFRPDVQLKDIRGNVPTRLDKLRAGDFDAIFLAAAGVSRLGLDIQDLLLVELNPREFVPAPAPGRTGLANQPRRYRYTPDPEQIAPLRHFRLHQRGTQGAATHERRLPTSPGRALRTRRDRNYHAFAACEVDGVMKRARVSSTTNMGVAEELIRQLKG